ncbi:MAG: putative monocarboxylate transporter mch1 [Icmadophila ericetorum]|nr:putative monocarboxylate transporter mch1 [Icmadophila ericetorum]
MVAKSPTRSSAGNIDRLDFDSNRNVENGSLHHVLSNEEEGLIDDVVDGVIERDRARMKRAVTRYLSFGIAIMNCLCAGSITAFSVYGHLFLSRLHYTQAQVNEVSIAGGIAMYLFVPLFGYLCDRFSARPVALLAAVLFGLGYLLAALTYHAGPITTGRETGWPVGVMVLGFIMNGAATSCMYLSAVTTCAKNFGRGKYKGLALSLPIASFGLSGMWQSQVASRLLYERNPDGSKGDVDVYRFFLFLSGLLFVMGLIGTFGLTVVDEEVMIDEAVDELERSGLLEESEFFRRSANHESNGYGTMRFVGEPNGLRRGSTSQKSVSESIRKKTWLLNAETWHFLTDPTMWFLTAGFFLVTGPGEAYINNFGTILDSLYPPPLKIPESNSTSTHVSIIASASTLARLLAGSLSDFLGPNAHNPAPGFRPSSRSSEEPLLVNTKRFTVSRMTFLLSTTALLTLAFALLASPLTAANPTPIFPVISFFIGLGYGAIFSLTPIIVSIVWGVENFGTNWGIIVMVPAGGSAAWGFMYALIYERAAESSDGPDHICYGGGCYEAAFWTATACGVVTLGLWLWAWKGKKGWAERRVVI